MKAQLDFTGRVCLVTGAGSSSGIGFAAARQLGELGAMVVVTATTKRIFDRVQELEAEGISARGYQADLMDPDQAGELTDRIIHEFGKIDVLINNAGMTQVGTPEIFGELADLAEKDWDETINRNLTICFRMTRSVLPYMIKAEYGRIVNVSSVTGPLVSNPCEAAYSAAKAGIVGMSRSAALETARKNIRINNVLPGWVATASQTEKEKAGAAATPVGRGAKPEEIGYMIVFLASEQASYITGQNFVVDGGNSIQEYKGISELYY